jgi:uncharacterized tellurite resistance protein B-like protein
LKKRWILIFFLNRILAWFSGPDGLSNLATVLYLGADSKIYPMTLPLAIENEQEASVAILLCCMTGQQDQHLIDAQFRHLSRMLSASIKFRGHSLEILAEKAMPLLATYGSKNVIEYSASFIPDNFKETLFTMICELVTTDGELSETESEVIGVAALYLGISIELMRVIVTTFLMRNRWNIT